jgi:hypothetical protein
VRRSYESSRLAVARFLGLAWAAVIGYWVGQFIASIVFYLKYAGVHGLGLNYGLESDSWWARHTFLSVGGVIGAACVVLVAVRLIPELRRWAHVVLVAAVVLLQPVLHYRWLEQEAVRAVALEGFAAGKADRLVTVRRERALDPLVDGLRRSAPGSAEAARALLRVDGGAQALTALALDTGVPASARIDAALALASQGQSTPEIDKTVATLMAGPDVDRLQIANRLGEHFGPRGPSVQAWLGQLLGDPDADVRLTAATAMLNGYGLSDGRPCATLEQLAAADEARIRRRAITHLNRCFADSPDRPSNRDARVRMLEAHLDDSDDEVRHDAAERLGALGVESGGGVADAFLRGGDRFKREEDFQRSERTLAQAWGERAVPILWTIHRCPSVAAINRAKALEALQQIYRSRNATIPEQYMHFIDPWTTTNRDPLLSAYCPA